MPRCLRTVLGSPATAIHRHQRCLRPRQSVKLQSAAAPVASAVQLPEWIFPYADAFDLDGRTVDADSIISMLTPQVSEERLARIEAVLDERTYNIIPVAEVSGQPQRQSVTAAWCTLVLLNQHENFTYYGKFQA